MSAVLNFDNEDHFHYDHLPRDILIPYSDIKQKLITANNCGKLLGNGSFGHVYEIINTDQVLKVCATRDLKSDAYHSYLKVPLSQSATNPFLPRVEKFIKYQAMESIVVYGVKMERLYSLDETPKAALKKMGMELVTNFIKGQHASYVDRDPSYTLVYRIKSAYTEATYKDVKNKDLIQALKSIHEIQKQNKHWNDMGKSNFMVRHILNWNTLSTDYQLVITDPLS